MFTIMDFKIPDFPDLSYGSIYCIGRNYVDHIKEMKSIQTSEPVVFLKPRSSIIHSGDSVHIPSQSYDVHHEAELVLLIGKETKNCPPQNALASVHAFGIGIDFTARDIQSQAKKDGRPWALSKGFDTFAPVGNLVNMTDDTDLNNMTISLQVNNESRQHDSTSLMIFKPADIISYLSHKFTLTPGDLIFTGTPKGVSPVKHGDSVTALLSENLSTVTIDVKT
jgi:2-keto-4-pentenoate hydratase/2-oxohepta-3-ene-1,7-dioic acid hydratase in catechol pathway